jgi:hypothetical protein
MPTFRLFIFAVLFCALCLAVSAQNQKNTSQKVKLSDVFLLEKNKPSVYITYERSGNAEPLYENESNERVWLRLHNNTKANISFCFFKVKPIYGDLGLYYEVRRNFSRAGTGDPDEEKIPEIKGANRNNSKQTETPLKSNIETPQGYSYGDVCVVYNLAAGKSVLFSIPREHLVNQSANFDIKIEFHYEGEEEGTEIAGHPQHIVYFGYGQLYWSERKELKNQK